MSTETYLRWLTSLVRGLLRFCFGLRAYNTAGLSADGPLLLVPNHVSWFDWLFLAVCLDENWKFVVSGRVARTSWVHRVIMLNRRTFAIDTMSPYAVKEMAVYLQKGGRMVLFAEGRISMTGSLMKLFEGTGFLLHKTPTKVITAYLRGASRMPFSPSPGWKRWFPTVTVHFSDPIVPPKPPGVSNTKARQVLTAWLRDRMVRQQFDVEMEVGPRSILAAVIEAARYQPKKIALEDAGWATLSYRQLLVGVDIFARRLRVILPESSRRVGVLLPNVNATPVVLLSLWSMGKVPAILNYSLGVAGILVCARLAGLEKILTSRVFLERAKLNPAPFAEAGIELICLEDIRARITGPQKFLSLLRVLVHSDSIAERHGDVPPESGVAVVLFTSGSEGTPKGVELLQRNVLANIRQMLAVCDMPDTDRIFNCLPLFHSFGLTVGLLLPLVRGLYAFLYPSPLHYRMVPSLFYDRDCTILLGTNTFLNGYARKASPYDFRSLHYIFAGAEKLQEATATTWSRQFGARILEGYGATECAPCISVNDPMSPRPGSVGRFMPGMEYRLEPAEGMEDCGRLFVRGPNVMRGYLNPDANVKFQESGGWYDTGDIARVDADGYLYLLGRLKRFAKVSGEMVSLTAVEDALAGAFPQFGLRCQVAVLTRPDEAKGEALIAVTNEPRLQIGAIREIIRSKGLSNLCAPREIQYVREIPKLGTGKVNHRELIRIVAAAGNPNEIQGGASSQPAIQR